ncbi:TPA: hypothetical protein ACPVYZ_004243 [Vibrio parahaemolyticus]|uniref:hypothetical protein n=1 Tax=Vibrio parahaemolyticus TaxID=670 RepID=UPI00111F0D4A|nr:hypothetical protein [Vibrio parahaemolyticus]MBE4286398.1 hypothetical protein [Vibrio parahaemolyticus]TOH19154.1 hypothetical protein CGI90_04015 [Vibrio parahaemolyticus]HCG7330438.1 hypothetical protein [Vibrio parahaemolyticus]HCG9589017.1 hypothetical protein [Vibrio parahaemolyticus]HCM0798091.1 hypothetical protein [Vibrio parahaemolyticus]
MPDKDYLHRQLIKLGDMMGDGLHLEPDGKWISQEYKKVAKALGYDVTPTRRSNVDGINKAMAKALETARCKCGGELKQTRSGSYRAKCTVPNCTNRYQFKAKRVKK